MIIDWNQGGSEIKLQISRRETPTLPTERRAQVQQSYFKLLPFAPAEITCLALPEILAEKIRACSRVLRASRLAHCKRICGCGNQRDEREASRT
jgi:Nucleotidyl transferase AbiEii toxin, Type IV TA system